MRSPPMKLPVFYDERMCATPASFSPSAMKPKLVVDDWLQMDPRLIAVHSFPQVDRSLLDLAHDPDYVDGVLEGTIENGFGSRDKDVARSLRWTVGSIVAAARHVRSAPRVWPECSACSPSSGFHHAHRAFARGYCTFNGLMVAAMDAVDRGAQRVEIIDCDYHYGDGTEDILRTAPVRYRIAIRHHTAGARYSEEHQAGAMLTWLRHTMREARGADLTLYQAGADQHVNDPLGGLLTSTELGERDRIVFRTAAQYNMPLVWNLAGGYQRTADGSIKPVLSIHRRTLETCVGIIGTL